MNSGPLRRPWRSILHGIGLGCGAALAGSLAASLAFIGAWVIPALVRGTLTLQELSPWHPSQGQYSFDAWSLLLSGTVFCFAAAVVPAGLGGGAIALVLHMRAPGSTSPQRLGTVVGRSAGAVAGILSVVVGHLLLDGLLLFAVFIWFGEVVYIGYPAMVLLAVGYAVFAGGRVGRRLARCEEARCAGAPAGEP